MSKHTRCTETVSLQSVGSMTPRKEASWSFTGTVTSRQEASSSHTGTVTSRQETSLLLTGVSAPSCCCVATTAHATSGVALSCGRLTAPGSKTDRSFLTICRFNRSSPPTACRPGSLLKCPFSLQKKHRGSFFSVPSAFLGADCRGWLSWLRCCVLNVPIGQPFPPSSLWSSATPVLFLAARR